MKTRARLLALPLLALAGCADNRGSLSLRGICAPPDSCRFSGQCDAYTLVTPLIDAVNNPVAQLTLFVEAENQLPDNADADVWRVNTNNAHVDEIVVEYSGISLPRAVMGTQQTVRAATISVLAIDVIPEALQAGAALAAYAPTATVREMTVTVRLRGYWDDGTRFETGEYPVAVQVCSNCLAACPATSTGVCPADGQLPRACIQ